MFSISTISAGVPFGTPMPVTALASKPGTVSATVGTSGSAAERCAGGHGERAELCPLRTGPIEADIGSNIICASPSIIAFSAGPAAGVMHDRRY